jgi:hypothetical protein
VVELFGNEGRGKCAVHSAGRRLSKWTMSKRPEPSCGPRAWNGRRDRRWNGFEWLYFRSPDGHLFSVKKTPPPGWEAGA